MVSTPQHRGTAATTATLGYQAERIRQNTSGWHPKLTPYRLIIIASTIAFGTAKAILTQRQSVETPITLEWLFGTMVSIMFFVVSAYDSREIVPGYLHWLFKPDCMDPVWRVLWTWFSIKRPNYTSEECSAPGNVHRDRPIITPYRILVCTTVTSIGMSKAMLGYYGFSTVVTWTDWALGVPLTMVLYCLGLYEYNASNVWHTFFATDQIHVFYSFSTLTLTTLRFSVCLAWTIFWWLSFQDVTYNPKWDMRTLRPEGFRPTTKSFFEDMADLSLKLVFQEFIIAAIVGGLVACFLALRQFMRQSGMLRVIGHIFPSNLSDLSTRPSRSILVRGAPAFRVVSHIALHLAGLVVIGTFTMLAAGFSVKLQGAIRPTGRDIICLTIPYIIPTFFVFVTAGLIFNGFRILFSLLFPFWRWFMYSTPLTL